MSNRDRSVEDGFPASSVPFAKLSFVTLSQPSLRPFFFHTADSNPSASFGSTSPTAASTILPATFTTTAFTALLIKLRLAGNSWSVALGSATMNLT
jgi:hypothetical protein